MTLAIFSKNTTIEISKPWKSFDGSQREKLKRLDELQGNYLAKIVGVDVKVNSKEDPPVYYAQFTFEVIDALKSEVKVGERATYSFDLPENINGTSEKAGIARARLCSLISGMYGVAAVNDGSALEKLKALLPEIATDAEDAEWEGRKIKRLKTRVTGAPQEDAVGAVLKVESVTKTGKPAKDGTIKQSARVYFKDARSYFPDAE